jgi:TFIIF-interacting CTD phosphatase-like protein
MDVTKDRHGKRKASHHDEEGKRKKKHHKGEQDSKSSSRKKDRHKAIKVVDDDAEDDEMWVEHNIDVDGQHVSGPSASELYKVLTTFPASHHSNPHWSELRYTFNGKCDG